MSGEATGQGGGDVEQAEMTRAAPSHAELERAIASVPGVVEASVGQSDESGRSRLRIRIGPGADPEAVSWAVAATLRERFGIALDPDAIRPRDTGGAGAPAAAAGAGRDAAEAAVPAGAPPEAGTGSGSAEDPIRIVQEASPEELAETRERLTAAARAAFADLAEEVVDELMAAGSEGSEAPAGDAADLAGLPATAGTPREAAGSDDRTGRAVIRHLDTHLDRDGVRVTATLHHAGRSSQGEAVSVPTSHGVLRAVAEATIAALRGLARERFVAGVDRVAMEPSADPAAATVAVTLVSDRGEEQLLGSSVVRGDPERAVMRATLDALNRRIAGALAGAEQPGA